MNPRDPRFSTLAGQANALAARLELIRSSGYVEFASDHPISQGDDSGKAAITVLEEYCDLNKMGDIKEPLLLILDGLDLLERIVADPNFKNSSYPTLQKLAANAIGLSYTFVDYPAAAYLFWRIMMEDIIRIPFGVEGLHFNLRYLLLYLGFDLGDTCSIIYNVAYCSAKIYAETNDLPFVDFAEFNLWNSFAECEAAIERIGRGLMEASQYRTKLTMREMFEYMEGNRIMKDAIASLGGELVIFNDQVIEA